MINAPVTGDELRTFLGANAPADLASVLYALAEASRPVAHLIRRGSLGGALDAAVGPAHDGVAQKALDVFADRSFVDGLKGSGVRCVVSEERDDPVAIDRNGTLLVAIDPLDGSSNIDANVTIGTVFSVLDAPAGDVEGAQFLQRGVRQRAAGLVVYGPHVAFVFTTGAGVYFATLDPDANEYRVSDGVARIPAEFERIRDQCSKLSPLARTGAALYRGPSGRGRRAAQAQLQHALDRLDGRRRLPHSDPRRCLSLP